MHAARRDVGSAVSLMLIVITVAVLAVVAVGHSGRVLIDRQRAQAAADAVALAAVVSGVDAAHDVARANDAEIMLLRDDGSAVSVTVRVRAVTARARAERGLAPDEIRSPRASARSGSLQSSR